MSPAQRKINDYAVVKRTDSVRDFLSTGRQPAFIIIDCGDGVFRVLSFADLDHSAKTFADMLGTASPADVLPATVFDRQPLELSFDRSFVVLLSDDAVVGLTSPGRSGTRRETRSAKRARPKIASISRRDSDTIFGMNTSLDVSSIDDEPAMEGGTLSLDEPTFEPAEPSFEPASEPAALSPIAAEPADKVSTVLNAEFEDHDDRLPLALGTAYVLAFFAGEKAAEVTAAVPMDVPFAPTDTESELTIQLTSEDFDIQQPSLPLLIKRDGRSRGRARFDVNPKRNGRGTIVAVVMKGGSFLNKITLEINVGNEASPAVGKVTSVGRAFSGEERIQARDLLLILEEDQDSFELTISKAVTARAKIPLTPQHLETVVANARKTLKEIVDTVDLQTAKRVYQVRLEIPEEIHRASLAKLAEAGFLLFRALFFAPAADVQLKNIGKRFIELVSGDPMAIQIVTTRFFIPWPMLYIADRFDPDQIDPDRFLGFRHRIEQIPLQNGFNVTEPEIRHQKDLVIGVNVNRDIDKDMKANFVESQVDFFNGVHGRNASVKVRDQRSEIQRALLDPQMNEQIVYFFCHAVSKSLAEGGPDASQLGLTGKEMLKLSDLRLADDVDPAPYRTNPLFIINACQSAELSPLFYDGFMPYLMAKGARGVIGTECDTPAIFAVEWARRFFRAFLEGAELGEVVLALRRQFLEQEKNVLGLLYAVHCNGDTRIDPALGLTAG